MANVNIEAYKKRVDDMTTAFDSQMQKIKAFGNTYGYTYTEDNIGTSSLLSCLGRDLPSNAKLGLPLGTPKAIGKYNNFSVYGYRDTRPIKSNTKERSLTTPTSQSSYGANTSTTALSDRADGAKKARWSSRFRFKFSYEDFKFDRNLFVIPAYKFHIDEDNSERARTPSLTSVLYPYIEEIIMTSRKNEKNFIHFINAQYSDGHVGHFNGRDYNFMVVLDRPKYDTLNERADDFATYTSIYTNDVATELAYSELCGKNSKLGVPFNGSTHQQLNLPIPDASFAQDMIDNEWDCRVIWRQDAPNRVNSIEYDIIQNTGGWIEGTISNTSREWYSVCYGKDKFVAVSGSSNISAYSLDGITWIESTISSTNREWYSVCYGKDKFVAVAANSSIFAYSLDGITWIESTISSTNREWFSVCYGKDKFVAVANSTNIFAYSLDGITWIESTISSTSRSWYSVCYGKDKFVVVARSSNYFAYSLNGITWIEGTISSTNREWFSVCYGKDKFVAVSSSTSIFAYSLNGITWIEGTISSTNRGWYSVCYGKDKFVVIANYSNYFAYSLDGITWIEGTISSTSRWWISVCYGKDKFVAIVYNSNIFAYSPDFLDFSPIKRIDTLQGRTILSNKNTTSQTALLSSTRNSIAGFKSINNNLAINNPTFAGLAYQQTKSAIYAGPYYGTEVNPKTPYSLNTKANYTCAPDLLVKLPEGYYMGFSYTDMNNPDVKISAKYAIFDKLFRSINETVGGAYPYPYKELSSGLSTLKTIRVLYETNVWEKEGEHRFTIYTPLAKYYSVFKHSSGDIPRFSTGGVLRKNFTGIIDGEIKEVYQISNTETLLLTTTGKVYRDEFRVAVNPVLLSSILVSNGILIGAHKAIINLGYPTCSIYDYESKTVTTTNIGANWDSVYNTQKVSGNTGCGLYTNSAADKYALIQIKENYSFDIEFDPRGGGG